MFRGLRIHKGARRAWRRAYERASANIVNSERACKAETEISPRFLLFYLCNLCRAPLRSEQPFWVSIPMFLLAAAPLRIPELCVIQIMHLPQVFSICLQHSQPKDRFVCAVGRAPIKAKLVSVPSTLEVFKKTFPVFVYVGMCFGCQDTRHTTSLS